MKNRLILILFGILVICGIQACNSPKNMPSNPSPQAPTATPTNSTPETTLTVTGTTTITCSFTPTATLTGTMASTNTPTVTPTLTSAVTPVPTHTELVTSTLTNTSTWTATETPTLTPTPTDTSTPTPTATPTFYFDAKWNFAAGPGGLATQGTTVYASMGNPVGVAVFDQLTDFSNPSTTWTSYAGSSLTDNVPEPLHEFTTVTVNPTNGNVYALDDIMKEIYQFTSAGAAAGSYIDNFMVLLDIKTDSNGNSYIVDGGADTVYEYNSSNVEINHWTQAGTTPLGEPTAVALDSSNNLYIADYGNEAIYELSASPGNPLVASWSIPHGGYINQMVVNGTGVIYASDYYLSQLEEYVPGTTTAKNEWNGTQGGGTQFGQLLGVVLLPNGNILTSDGGGFFQEFYP